MPEKARELPKCNNTPEANDCPFCGAVETWHVEEGGVVQCDVCMATGPFSKDDPVGAWNQRTLMTPEQPEGKGYSEKQLRAACTEASKMTAALILDHTEPYGEAAFQIILDSLTKSKSE